MSEFYWFAFLIISTQNLYIVLGSTKLCMTKVEFKKKHVNLKLLKQRCSCLRKENETTFET